MGPEGIRTIFLPLFLNIKSSIVGSTNVADRNAVVGESLVFLKNIYFLIFQYKLPSIHHVACSW